MTSLKKKLDLLLKDKKGFQEQLNASKKLVQSIID